jgi:hypothetical protein
MPNIDKLEPTRPKLRTDRVEPMTTKSSSDSAAPTREKLRNDNVLPK